MSHHTEAQGRAAFVRAREVLLQLKAAGCESPRFELFADGSGKIVLGRVSEVTREVWALAVELVRSDRMASCPICWTREQSGETYTGPHNCEVAIHTCCGLVREGG